MDKEYIPYMQLGEGGAATVYEAEVLSQELGADFDTHLTFAVKKVGGTRFSPRWHLLIAGASSLSARGSFNSVPQCRLLAQMHTNCEWRK